MLREIAGTLISTRQLEINEVLIDTSTVIHLDPVTGALSVIGGVPVSLNNLVQPTGGGASAPVLPGQFLIADNSSVFNPQSLEGDGTLIRVTQDAVTQNLVITSGSQVVEGNTLTLYGQPHNEGVDQAGGILNLQAGTSSGLGLSFVNISVPDTSTVSGSATNATSQKIIIPSKIKGSVSDQGFTNIIFSVPLPLNSFASFQLFVNVELAGTDALAVWCSQILITAVRSANSPDQFSFKGDNRASSVSAGAVFEAVPQLVFNSADEKLMFSIQLTSNIIAQPLIDLIIYNHSRSLLTF